MKRLTPIEIMQNSESDAAPINISDGLAALLERRVTGQMLRHQAGRQMVCPGCESILDGGDAVSLDLIRAGRLVATRMVCAECADAGAVRRAYIAGRAKCRDFTLRPIDGRLLDADDCYHPPETLYRIGARGGHVASTNLGREHVRGVEITILHPAHAARERWFAYRRPPEGGGTWWMVHSDTGFAVGRARSLRGCIHCGLAKLLRSADEKISAAIAKARRLADRQR